MVYDIDQCEECGAVRIANSKLCPQCLVKERDILEKEVLIKMAVIEVQRKRILNLEAMLKESTGYGFRRNQEVDLLLKSHKRLEDRLGEVMGDGKDR